MKMVVSKRGAGSTRRLALGLGIALTAGTMLAPLATAGGGGQNQDFWPGVWHTHNKFGSPRLNLELENKGDHYRVEGRYRDDGGEIKGKIGGKLSDGNKEWSGNYHDTKGGSDSGTFDVHLKKDKVSFKGEFYSNQAGKSFDWTGEHA